MKHRKSTTCLSNHIADIHWLISVSVLLALFTWLLDFASRKPLKHVKPSSINRSHSVSK